MAWSYVQGKQSGATSSNVSTKSVTLGSSVTSGDIVIGVVSFGGSATAQISSIVDDQGNDYTASLITILDSTEPQVVGMFWGLPTNSPKTFTCTLTTGKSFFEIWVDEFSGSDATTNITGHGLQIQASPTTTTDAVKSGSTFGNSGDLRYGQNSADDTNAVTITKGTGYTQALNTSPASMSNTSLCTEWETASGAADVTFTYSTNTRAVTGGMSFSPPASPGGATVPWPLFGMSRRAA